MKQSIFNHFIEEDKCVLCYNGWSDAQVLISHKCYQMLKNNDIECLQERYAQVYDTLCNSGFLIDEKSDELGILRLQNKREVFSSDIYYLMIYPTQDCNLKCWYCYETHIKNSKMSNAVLEAVLNHITRVFESKKYSFIRITFFGGEPLLYYEKVVKPILQHTQGQAEKHKIDWTPFFVTNASLLSLKVVQEMVQYKPLFQITLDGGRDKHDMTRIYKSNNNKGTYDKILGALKLISSCCTYSHNGMSSIATIRINYENSTLESIDNLLRDLSQLDPDKFFIHLERVWQTINTSSPESVVLLKDTLKKMNGMGFSVGHGIFGYKRVSCPAEVDKYAIINWDGNVYKCNGRTLVDKDKVGVLGKDGVIIWDDNKIAKRSAVATFENSICLSCCMLPQCLGPCSQKQIELVDNNDDNLKKVCALNLLDMTLDDYIRVNFELNMSKTKSE